MRERLELEEFFEMIAKKFGLDYDCGLNNSLEDAGIEVDDFIEFLYNVPEIDSESVEDIEHNINEESTFAEIYELFM